MSKLFAIYLEFKVLIAFFFLIFILFYFFAALRRLRDPSSPTRDRTQALALEVRNPNPWTTREFPQSSHSFLLPLSFLFFS